MIKFLIKFGTFLLCTAILVLGALQTVKENNVEEMVDKLEYILSSGGTSDGDGGYMDSENKDGPSPDVPDEPIVPDEPVEELTPAEKTENALKDLYDNHNPALSDAKKETISTTIGSSIDTSTEDGELISDIVNSYVDNLFSQIDAQREQNSGASEEENNAARDEFARRETEALSGLVDILNTSTEGDRPSDEQISSSVESVLDSEVCLGTVVSITEDEEMTERIQEATAEIDDSAMEQIQNTIQTKLDETRASEELSDEELALKEDQYRAIADLFGITLN